MYIGDRLHHPDKPKPAVSRMKIEAREVLAMYTDILDSSVFGIIPRPLYCLPSRGRCV